MRNSMKGDMLLLRVRVVPNARKASVAEAGNGAYRVRVDAPAAEGKANSRLIEILAEHFHVRKSEVSIIRGSHSREKEVRIRHGA